MTGDKFDEETRGWFIAEVLAAAGLALIIVLYFVVEVGR